MAGHFVAMLRKTKKTMLLLKKSAALFPKDHLFLCPDVVRYVSFGLFLTLTMRRERVLGSGTWLAPESCH